MIPSRLASKDQTGHPSRMHLGVGIADISVTGGAG
jgi:hypothetical protein